MKFKGFYRISRVTPSPVIPLFEGENLVLCQSSEDGDHLDGYISVEVFDEKRIFVTNEHNIHPPQVGESVIYAYEYKDDSVAVGSLQSVKSRISSFIQQNQQASIGTFAKLEAAYFTGDDSLVRKSAIDCFFQLQKISNSLSEKWLSGAPIDQSIKDHILQNYGETTSLKLRHTGFRIQILKFIIDEIDYLARKKDLDRNTFISLQIRNTQEALGESIYDEFNLNFYEEFDLFLNNINEYKLRIQNASNSKESISRILETEPDEKKRNAYVAQYFLEEASLRTKLIYESRPSIRLSDKEIKTMRTVLNKTRRQSERSKAAFIVFCVAKSNESFVNNISIMPELKDFVIDDKITQASIVLFKRHMNFASHYNI